MSRSMRKLGQSGLEVATVGVGCNAFGARVDQQQTQAIVDAALDEGVNFFDTADSYSRGQSEVMLGRALTGRRDQVIVATKFGMTMQGDNGPETARASKSYMRKAVEASLKRLGTDYIDLYQLHTPDRVTPIADTLGAMTELIDEGKVRAIGCSNFQAWELVDADWTSKSLGFAHFATAQNEYSLYNRAAETELVPACLNLGVGLLPYFPLAYGLLTGKYQRDQSAPEGSRLAMAGQESRLSGADWDRIERLQAFARARSISLLQLAIGGLAAQPAVASVIAGVSRPEQIIANVAAAEWVPDSDELQELADLSKPSMSYTTYAPWRRF